VRVDRALELELDADAGRLGAVEGVLDAGAGGEVLLEAGVADDHLEDAGRAVVGLADLDVDDALLADGGGDGVGRAALALAQDGAARARSWSSVSSAWRWRRGSRLRTDSTPSTGRGMIVRTPGLSWGARRGWRGRGPPGPRRCTRGLAAGEGHLLDGLEQRQRRCRARR
jgi:hypothetical protein